MAFVHQTRFVTTNHEIRQDRNIGQQILADARSRIQPLVAAWNAFPQPQPGSALSQINALNEYKPFSYQVRDLLTVSVDSLRMLDRYIGQTNEIPMVAHYALIRSAVEASSFGIWLMNAGTNQKKAWLSLRLSYENNEDLEGLERVLASSDSPTPNRDDIRRRLLQIQQTIPDYRSHDITRRPTTTNVVAEADKYMTRKQTYARGVQVWKACSGVAHANSDVIHALLERQPAAEPDELGQKFLLTSRVALTAGFILTAVENTEELERMFRGGCVAPHASSSRRR